MPQLDIQDRERDNRHRAGPDNVSNLCGNLVHSKTVFDLRICRKTEGDVGREVGKISLVSLSAGVMLTYINLESTSHQNHFIYE